MLAPPASNEMTCLGQELAEQSADSNHSTVHISCRQICSAEAADDNGGGNDTSPHEYELYPRLSSLSFSGTQPLYLG